jgi:hypothetical protein
MQNTCCSASNGTSAVRRSTERVCEQDEYIIVVVQDNGTSGDRVTIGGCFEEEPLCDEVTLEANLELTEGNIIVQP